MSRYPAVMGFILFRKHEKHLKNQVWSKVKLGMKLNNKKLKNTRNHNNNSKETKTKTQMWQTKRKLQKKKICKQQM